MKFFNFWFFVIAIILSIVLYGGSYYAKTTTTKTTIDSSSPPDNSIGGGSGTGTSTVNYGWPFPHKTISTQSGYGGNLTWRSQPTTTYKYKNLIYDAILSLIAGLFIVYVIQFKIFKIKNRGRYKTMKISRVT
jgi:hypothetical protein